MGLLSPVVQGPGPVLIAFREIPLQKTAERKKSTQRQRVAGWESALERVTMLRRY
jgi:hypothetical protein